MDHLFMFFNGSSIHRSVQHILNRFHFNNGLIKRWSTGKSFKAISSGGNIFQTTSNLCLERGHQIFTIPEDTWGILKGIIEPHQHLIPSFWVELSPRSFWWCQIVSLYHCTPSFLASKSSTVWPKPNAQGSPLRIAAKLIFIAPITMGTNKLFIYLFIYPMCVSLN